ncbi:MAG TPA: thiol:disulfide interchange protein DsbA/DsbL [Steroidobacteraceae bacterium]
MIRKLSLLAVLTLSAADLLTLTACSRHSHVSQQAATPASQPTAAPAPPAAAAGGPVSSAQAADADSTSLERLAAVPASTELPTSSQWKPSVNYDVISPAQPSTVAAGKVEVLEVFWLGCPHCYALESYIRQWLKTKPSYVEFVRVPVMWGPMHRAHARLFYTLESLGGDALVEKVFTYIHNTEEQTGNESVLVSNSEEDTFRQQQAWATQNGIDADAFAKAYNSFYVTTQLQQAEAITSNYQVQGVPFIAVDGQFSTDVGKASGDDDPTKLISLINFLAAWEHDHKQGSG